MLNTDRRSTILAVTIVGLFTSGLVLGLPAPAVAGEPPALLVLVPDLRWRDAPPALATFARANLSVRAASTDGDPADGFLTIGKGARSAAPDGGIGPVVEEGAGGWRIEGWSKLLRHDRGLRYPGELGALGEALRRSGRTWALVTNDRRAATAAADAEGFVPRGVTGGAEALAGVLRGGPDAVIAAVGAGELPSVLAAGERARCVVVASVSTADLDHLGVMATSAGCGFGREGLTSPSTHQPRLVTLPDVAPTFLAALGTRPPRAMSGFPVEPSGGISVPGLVERDRRASVADQVRTPLVWLFVGLHAVAAVVVVASPRLRRVAVPAILAVPPAGFLLMVVPWWRWGFPGAVLTGGLIAATLATVAWALARRHPSAGVIFLLAVTTGVIALDALFGGPLEVDAPFGNSPIRGGRYYGVGNVGFAFLATSLLVGGAVTLDRRGGRATVFVPAALVAAVVVIGAPWFGADAGGVVAAVPAFGVLVLGRRGGRLPWKRLATVVALGCLALALLATLDALRPEESRTHLGRALTGDGPASIAVRKGSRALASVTAPLTTVSVIGLLALVVARPPLAGRPAVRAGAWGTVTLAVLGSAVNDSGLQVAGAVTAVAWPAFVALTRRPSTPARS